MTIVHDTINALAQSIETMIDEEHGAKQDEEEARRHYDQERRRRQEVTDGIDAACIGLDAYRERQNARADPRIILPPNVIKRCDRDRETRKRREKEWQPVEEPP